MPGTMRMVGFGLVKRAEATVASPFTALAGHSGVHAIAYAAP